MSTTIKSQTSNLPQENSAELKTKKIALIEVKPAKEGYVAKEMAGGLGKRVKLSKGYFGRILSSRLISSFCAPPMVLAQLSGVCRSLKHDIKAFHTANAGDVDGDTQIAIVLGSMVDYHNEIEFINALREKNANIKIIVVGSFPSAMPDIYEACADFVIKGDPEVALQSILEKGYPSEKILQSERPDDLNTLPMPDWEPFIKNNYFAKRPFSKELGVAIQKSKGCSMTCNYCPYASFYGKARHYDSDYVLKAIKYYKDKHNIRYFMFRDPNFGENRKEFHIFMEKLIDSKLDIGFSCEARLDTFKSDDDLKLMAQAGLNYIITGIESNDEDILKQNMRRPIKKEDAFRKIKVLEKNGVIVQTNFILGFPGETEKGVLDTIDYAKALNTMFATFHIYTPQPGTQIFDNFKSKLLDIDWEDFSYSNLVWKHDTLSKEFLDKTTEDTYSEYYFRPQWILKHFGRLVKILI